MSSRFRVPGSGFKVLSLKNWHKAGFLLFFTWNLELGTRNVLGSVSTVRLETIGMYHVPPDAYAMVKSLGIESVQVPLHAISSKEEAEALLAETGKNGLQVFFGIYEKNFDSRQILRSVELYKSRSEITYWYLADEPDIHQIEPDTIRQITQFIRISDPKKRPTFITISDLNFGPKDGDKVNIRGKAYSAYKDVADISGILKYDSPKKLRIYLDSFVYPEMAGKRWWAIVSLNQQPEDLKKSVDLFMEGQPAGLLYYAFADDSWGFNLRERTDIQEALREINAKLRPGKVLQQSESSATLKSSATAVQTGNSPVPGAAGMPPWIRTPVMDLSKPSTLGMPPAAILNLSTTTAISTETAPSNMPSSP
ncbi:MAG: hypothetical protein HY547_01560 [Elusimicrobia bacterium]|nr:hypothetical protein [Elusimicrobiota bacterium]